MLGVIEPGKEIPREKRFGGPERLSRPHSPEPDARRENLERKFALQEQSDFVLLFRFGVKAVPEQGCGWLFVNGYWLMVI